MPKLTNEELRARVAAGEVGAITLDTSIFDRHQCHLGYASLRKLDQFCGGHVSVLISEIVMNEVIGHIARDAEKSQRELAGSLKVHARRWDLDPEDAKAPVGLKLDIDPDIAAREQYDAYVLATGATIVPAVFSGATAETVLGRYFAKQPPFEKSEKKKNEFPDAFALVSLEEHGAGAHQLVLCVSGDGGWQEFADASEHLVCLPDLDQALSLFNEAGQVVADRVLELLRAGQAASIAGGIESEFAFRFDYEFDCEAESFAEFDAEPESAVLDWIDWANAPAPTVIALDADSVTLTMEIMAAVKYDANFSFYVQDSIDRDYVGLGGLSASAKQTDPFKLALTVSREMEDEPELFDVELSRKRIVVDFGMVHPFEDEDPERR